MQKYIAYAEGRPTIIARIILTIGIHLIPFNSETSGPPSFAIILTTAGIIVNILDVKMA